MPEAANPGVQPSLTLALAHYDRTVPFFDGSAGVPGVGLQVLEVGQTVPGRHGERRHERMLQDCEFDAAEVSLSSYLIARERELPFTAIPVFPRRLFSLSQIWCRTDAGIRAPADLIGRRVGLNTFQTTLSVLAKADLLRSYGLDWRRIRWVLARPETYDFKPLPGVMLERVAAEAKLEEALLAGDIDALIHPHPPRVVLEHPGRIARLFPDPEAEEKRYLSRYGYFPIMHVVALRRDLPERMPGVARALFAAFEQAWEICRRRWDDPNWSWLAWGRHAYERERQLGTDMWDNGLARNRANLEWFVDQSRQQGLTTRHLPVDGLFDSSVLDT